MVNATEMSTEQMAASVLGMDAHYLTIAPFYLFAWEAVEQIRTRWSNFHGIKQFKSHCVQSSQDDAVDDSGAAHDEDEQNAGVDQHESGAEDTDLYQDVDYDRLQHEERFAISMNKAKHLRSISIDEDETVGTSSQFEYWLHRGEKLQHISSTYGDNDVKPQQSYSDDQLAHKQIH